MKKFFAAVCCVLLVGGSVVAQEVATPVADAAATATEVVVQEVAPVAVAAPVAGSVMESTVVGQGQVLPMMSTPMVQTPGCCGQGVAAPFSGQVMTGQIINSAPMATTVMGSPAVMNSGCSSCGNVVSAPVATGCSTCATAAPRTRRYVVRSAVSGLRSRVGGRRSSCCN